jgi:ActR/RegA family two-component response regulator
MFLQTLVLSRDEQVRRLLQSSLAADGLAPEFCLMASEAMSKLQKQKFDGIFIDCQSGHEGLDVLQAIRHGRSNQHAIVIALVRREKPADEFFKAGANFILEAPLNALSIRRTLQAAHGLIVAERRRYSRQPIYATLSVSQRENGSARSTTLDELWIVVNVSEGGLGAIAPKPLESINGTIHIRFQLPTHGAAIEGNAIIAWTRDRHAGLKFTGLQPVSRHSLNRFLSAKLLQ